MINLITTCTSLPWEVTPQAPPSQFLCEEMQPCAPLPIWEIDPQALFIVLAMLIDRKETETLLAERTDEDCSHVREEVFLRSVFSHCRRPCLFAVCIEQMLDRYTKNARERFARCSLFELAQLWSRTQNQEGSLDLGAFCWSLASDARDIIKELRERVMSEVMVRALRHLHANSKVIWC